MNKKVLAIVSVLFFGMLVVAVTATAVVVYALSKQTQPVPPIAQNTPQTSFEENLSKVLDSDLANHAEDQNVDSSTELSAQEIEDLKYMREEEKLAHDVYVALYNKWGLQIFQNISQSEQKHTDSIGTLIKAFGLTDPYSSKPGEFSNPTLQALYTQLVEKGEGSVEAALNVGALIEDLDIVDLEKALDRTDNASIINVYDNLQRGSRNHIRSFTSMLGRYGEKYTPTYLTEAEYLEIISSGTEKGSGGNRNGRN